MKKWVYSFKYLGTCCEFLGLGEGKSHEFLSTPTEVSTRGTSSEKRTTKGGSVGVGLLGRSHIHTTPSLNRSLPFQSSGTKIPT